MANGPLLHKYIDQIEQLPQTISAKADESWCQGTWITAYWKRDSVLGRDVECHSLIKSENGKLAFEGWEGFCGTAFCLAGNIAIDTAPLGTIFKYRANGQWDMILPDTEEPVELSKWAAEQVGLTNIQAEHMFAASNDIPQLRQFTDRFDGTSQI